MSATDCRLCEQKGIHDCLPAILKLREENQKLKRTLEHHLMDCGSLREERDRYRAALERIAPAGCEGPCGQTECQLARIAREALEQSGQESALPMREVE